jgi:Bacterial Ig-like domain (group 3)
MELPSASKIVLACLAVIGSVGIANCQNWTPLTNRAPVSMGAMLLLTDGRVLVHEEPNCSGTGCVGKDYTAWYTLTPDHTGSYINGTWTKAASLPSGYSPLFFGSAVLPDGKVVIQGGEYNCPGGSCSAVWQSLGALYDPAANTWTSTTPPVLNSWQALGDAQSIVLPNGTWMLAACCAKIAGRSTFPLYFYFNESTLTFTTEANATDGKFDDFDEEGWSLLPNGDVLTVDAYVGSYTAKGMNSELYNPSTNTWTTAGSTLVQLWDSDCGNASKASQELGPAVLMPNGTVFYTGASSCSAGNIATYDWSTATWTAQAPFPNKDAANDAPASIETNGNVIVMSSPFSPTFSAPSTFYEWNGSSLSVFPGPANAVNDPSFVGHLLALPSGEILFTDYTTGVEVLTTAGTYQPAWQPTITTAPVNVSPGKTYSISGTQFNGLSQGAAYGDDFQDATNYPLVRIVNTATGSVFYAKTHGHSTMGVATGTAPVSTNFDVPAGIPTGPCELYVVANGIPSNAKSCDVGFATTTALTSTPNPSTLGQSVTFTATVSSSSGTPTGKVTFKDGTTTLGTVTLTSGVATFATSTLTHGKHKITARYGGSSKFAPSSVSLTQTVN